MEGRQTSRGRAAEAAGVPPPIELDTLVPCSPDAAFAYFTRDIARWWPLSRHSCSLARAAGVAFQEGVGGLLVEKDVDGNEHVWGTVLDWDPGRRVRFTWHPGKDAAAALEVDVTFHPAGAMTRVRLVHSGWGRLGKQAASARANYAGGWPTVLQERFRIHCEHAAGHPAAIPG